jgi:hypothetical protein
MKIKWKLIIWKKLYLFLIFLRNKTKEFRDKIFIKVRNYLIRVKIVFKKMNKIKMNKIHPVTNFWNLLKEKI